MINSAREYLREGWRTVRPVWPRALLVIVLWAVLTNVASLACFVPLLVVGGPLTGGLYLFFAKRLVGLEATVGDLFLGFRRFGPTAIVYLVATVVFFLTLMMLWAPVALLDALGVVETEDFEAMPVAVQLVLGPYALLTFLLASTAVGVVFTFGMPVALFGVRATRGAVSRTRENLGRVLSLNLTGGILVVVASVVGILLCLVGLVILQPLALAVLIVAQLALFRDTAGLDAGALAPFATPTGGAPEAALPGR
jgi:hypothetical protein